MSFRVVFNDSSDLRVLNVEPDFISVKGISQQTYVFDISEEVLNSVGSIKGYFNDELKTSRIKVFSLSSDEPGASESLFYDLTDYSKLQRITFEDGVYKVYIVQEDTIPTLLSKIQQDLATTKNDLQATSSSVESVNASVTALSESTSQAAAAQAQAMSSLESKFEEVNTKANETASALENTQAAINNVQTSIEGHDDKISSIMTNVEEVSTKANETASALENTQAAINNVQTSIEGQETKITSILSDVEGVKEDVISIKPVEKTRDEMTLEEYKAYVIAKSKKNLSYWMENKKLSSTVHGELGQYSITATKQQQLAAMILLAQADPEFKPSWNETGKACTYDWTLEQLIQLAFEIEQLVRPQVSKQQKMEEDINAATSKDAVDEVNIEFQG